MAATPVTASKVLGLSHLRKRRPHSKTTRLDNCRVHPGSRCQLLHRIGTADRLGCAGLQHGVALKQVGLEQSLLTPAVTENYVELSGHPQHSAISSSSSNAYVFVFLSLPISARTRNDSRL